MMQGGILPYPNRKRNETIATIGQKWPRNENIPPKGTGIPKGGIGVYIAFSCIAARIRFNRRDTTLFVVWSRLAISA